MKELYRFRQFLKEDESEHSEENPMVFTLPQVGGDTGVKLPMRKIFRMLKDAGYDPEITDGNKITGIKNITIGVGDDEFSAGTLIISRNGQTFGNDLWGKDIKSENELFPLIDEYYKDQLDYSTDTLDEGFFSGLVQATLEDVEGPFLVKQLDQDRKVDDTREDYEDALGDYTYDFIREFGGSNTRSKEIDSSRDLYKEVRSKFEQNGNQITFREIGEIVTSNYLIRK